MLGSEGCKWEGVDEVGKGGKDCSRIQRVVGDGVLSVMRLGYHNAELGTKELLGIIRIMRVVLSWVTEGGG